MSNINLLFTYILKCNIEEREGRCIEGKSPIFSYSYSLFVDYIQKFNDVCPPYHKFEMEEYSCWSKKHLEFLLLICIVKEKNYRVFIYVEYYRCIFYVIYE